MSRADQSREEEHFHQVEAAMLHVEDAARRLTEAAEQLKDDGAEGHLIAALETAAGAVRADHSRLMKSVCWQVPASDQGELVVGVPEFVPDSTELRENPQNRIALIRQICLARAIFGFLLIQRGGKRDPVHPHATSTRLRKPSKVGKP
jgi:hypothetical protein